MQLSNKTVKTRKEHRCWGCSRTFPKGAMLNVNTTKDSEGFDRTYWCGTCVMVWNKHFGYDDMIGEGDLIEHYPEYYTTESKL